MNWNLNICMNGLCCYAYVNMMIFIVADVFVLEENIEINEPCVENFPSAIVALSK